MTAEQIQHSFWAYRPEMNFLPEAVHYPDEFDGRSRLNLVCTQLDLSSYQQKKLVDDWCQLLPKLTLFKYLWFSSRTNQAMFEATCKISTLEGLYIDWRGIKDLSPLTNLRDLKYLHIGSSPFVGSILPLKSMDQLVVLHIENFKPILDLHPLGAMINLEGLAVWGSTWTTQTVDSLAPLSSLNNFQYAYLENLKSLENSLLTLLELKQLVNLVIGYHWSKNEMRLLKENLPELQYGSLFHDELIEKFGKRDKHN